RRAGFPVIGADCFNLNQEEIVFPRIVKRTFAFSCAASAALPSKDRHQQLQVHHGPGEEQDDYRADEDQ
ncbi:hypothetical protein ABLO16_02320, partial [Mycobacterium tuberculosis]